MSAATRRPVEIVLTGGPCGGKSTALSIVSQKLADWGFRPLVVPEVATMLIGGGISDIGAIAAANREQFTRLEGHFLSVQRALRERYRALAADFDEPVVIVYDRGEADVAAYLDEGEWARLLVDLGLSYADVRDSYDGVVHLVTAADGAEAFYTTTNNAARRETVAEARALDTRTLAAWIGHPRLRVVDNSTGFEQKMHRTLSAIAHLLGVPQPLEIERKFLLSSPPTPAQLAALGAKPVAIEQVYLRPTADGCEVRVRRRGDGTHAMYYRTEKQQIGPLTRIEREQIIGRHAYDEVLAEADPARRPIRKIRHCFVHAGAYFELDEFLSPAGLWLLEVELAEEGEQVSLPAGLAIAREVTEEPGWSNAELARLADAGR